MSGIFISHALDDADASLALRVHRELERVGLTVWRRHVSSTDGSDVVAADSAIMRCDAFLLLDSRRARTSLDVRDDCNRVCERMAGPRDAPRNIVCLLEPNGYWRYEDEPLERHVRIHYVNLAPPCAPGQPFESSGDTCYANGMAEMCRLLGVPYAPDHAKPRDGDFFEELSILNLRGSDRDSLVEAYSRFRNFSDHGQLASAKAVLCDMRAQLVRLRVAIVTPLIALGALNAALCDDAAAEQAFADAARAAPKDSRAWAGLGAARAWQRKYARASEAYDCAVRLLRRSNDSLLEQTTARVYVDAAFVACETGKYRRAIELLDSAERLAPSSAPVLALRGRVLLRSGEIGVAYDTLEAAFAESAFVYGMGSGVAIDLADCAEIVGDFERESEVLHRALRHDPDDDALIARIAGIGRFKSVAVGDRRA